MTAPAGHVGVANAVASAAADRVGAPAWDRGAEGTVASASGSAWVEAALSRAANDVPGTSRRRLRASAVDTVLVEGATTDPIEESASAVARARGPVWAAARAAEKGAEPSVMAVRRAALAGPVVAGGLDRSAVASAGRDERAPTWVARQDGSVTREFSVPVAGSTQALARLAVSAGGPVAPASGPVTPLGQRVRRMRGVLRAPMAHASVAELSALMPVEVEALVERARAEGRASRSARSAWGARRAPVETSALGVERPASRAVAPSEHAAGRPEEPSVTVPGTLRVLSALAADQAGQNAADDVVGPVFGRLDGGNARGADRGAVRGLRAAAPEAIVVDAALDRAPDPGEVAPRRERAVWATPRLATAAHAERRASLAPDAPAGGRVARRAFLGVEAERGARSMRSTAGGAVWLDHGEQTPSPGAGGAAMPGDRRSVWATRQAAGGAVVPGDRRPVWATRQAVGGAATAGRTAAPRRIAAPMPATWVVGAAGTEVAGAWRAVGLGAPQVPQPGAWAVPGGPGAAFAARGSTPAGAPSASRAVASVAARADAPWPSFVEQRRSAGMGVALDLPVVAPVGASAQEVPAVQGARSAWSGAAQRAVTSRGAPRSERPGADVNNGRTRGVAPSAAARSRSGGAGLWWTLDLLNPSDEPRDRANYGNRAPSGVLGSAVLPRPDRSSADDPAAQSQPMRGTPGWARRAVVPELAAAPYDAGARRVQREQRDVFRALAGASRPDEVVRVILERGEAMKSLAEALPAPARRLVQTIAALGAEAEAAVTPERKTRAPSAIPPRASSPHTEMLQPRGDASSTGGRRGPKAWASASTHRGLGESQVMKLAGKLMNLIHLAEVEQRLAEAQRQVRMSDEEVGQAGASGPGGAGGAGQEANIQALRRDVLEAVMREFELGRKRAEEDPDGRDIWW